AHERRDGQHHQGARRRHRHVCRGVFEMESVAQERTVDRARGRDDMTEDPQQAKARQLLEQIAQAIANAPEESLRDDDRRLTALLEAKAWDEAIAIADSCKAPGVKKKAGV